MHISNTEDVVVTEVWNGTNWTEVNDMNNKRNNGVGAGTALLYGGFRNAPPDDLAECESWNGTNWTEVNDVNQKVGTDNTNALIFGGATPLPQPAGQGPYAGTEEWNTLGTQQ